MKATLANVQTPTATKIFMKLLTEVNKLRAPTLTPRSGRKTTMAIGRAKTITCLKESIFSQLPELIAMAHYTVDKIESSPKANGTMMI